MAKNTFETNEGIPMERVDFVTYRSKKTTHEVFNLARVGSKGRPQKHWVRSKSMNITSTVVKTSML